MTSKATSKTGAKPAAGTSGKPATGTSGRAATKSRASTAEPAEQVEHDERAGQDAASEVEAPEVEQDLGREPAEDERDERDDHDAHEAADELDEDEDDEFDSEDDDEPERAGTAKKGGGRRALRRPDLQAGSPGRSRLLHAAVLLALAASIITAFLQWQQAGDLAAKDATEREVRTRASEFGQALLSYDHTNLKAARDRVMGLSTGDFSKFYDVDFAGALGPLITKLKANAQASVREVYLTEVDGSRAKAVVVMDSEVKSTSGTRRVLGSYLDLEMLKIKGEWRVNSVSSVGTINESMTNPDGTPVVPEGEQNQGQPSDQPSPQPTD